MTAPEIISPDSTPEQLDLETIAFLFGTIEAQITRADTKAGLVVAADSVFATALTLLSGGTLLKLFDPSAGLVERAAAVMIVIVFALLLCSTLYALVAARPNLRVNPNDDNLFFFGKISTMAHPDFVDNFTQQDEAKVRRAILTQIHTTSRIATQKFVRIRYSLDFLIAAVLAWTLIQLLVALTPQ